MAAIANIMFALFTHACLRTLSYNTIGMLATMAYGIGFDGEFQIVSSTAFYNRNLACYCSVVLSVYGIGICAVCDWSAYGKDRKKKPLESKLWDG